MGRGAVVEDDGGGPVVFKERGGQGGSLAGWSEIAGWGKEGMVGRGRAGELSGGWGREGREERVDEGARPSVLRRSGGAAVGGPLGGLSRGPGFGT